MKALVVCLFISVSGFTTDSNRPVDKIDLKKYAGKWYSLYSIPTLFDKGSRETTTSYTLNTEGYYDVITTYKKSGDETVYSRKSKMFPSTKDSNGELKAQFIWPIKVDYWIIELADDYSYVVVGHPERKFLFIMSRSKKMTQKDYEAIVARCKAKGYAVSELTSQLH